MNQEKDFGATAAQTIEEIDRELHSQIRADAENTETKYETYTEKKEAEETMNHEYTARSETEHSEFSKEDHRPLIDDDLKENIRNLIHELGNGARVLIDGIREKVPNRTLRILAKIGVGVAVFALINSWIGKAAIAVGAVYLLFETEKKENAK